MLEKTVAKRWASALLVLAEKEEKVEQVETSLVLLKRAFKSDADFRTFLTHPRIPKADKKSMISKLLEAGLLLQFLGLVIDKGRAQLIPDIADSFDEQADSFKGIVRVKVKSYMALSDSVKKELTDKISALVGGKKVELNEEVDHRILGGLWVKIGDTLIDGSVLTKYNSLRESLYRRK